MGNVIRTAIDSARAEKEADSSPTQTVDANALAAPANFTVDENGNYSFDGVENAQYYYVYVYSTPPAWRPWPRASRSRRTEALLIPEA